MVKMRWRVPPPEKDLPSRAPGTAEAVSSVSLSARQPTECAVHGAETSARLLRLDPPWQTLLGASFAGGWEFRKEDEYLGIDRELWPVGFHMSQQCDFRPAFCLCLSVPQFSQCKMGTVTILTS